MKLTKEDYMRLPKERLAELLAERDNEVIQPIVIPAQPAITPNDPWRSPYPLGPTITYANYPNTNETATDGKEHRAYYDAH